MHKTNQIQEEDFCIIIQSCTHISANIGISTTGPLGELTYCHVDLPSLQRDPSEPFYPFGLSKAEFDRVLEDNREDIVTLCQQLTGRKKFSWF